MQSPLHWPVRGLIIIACLLMAASASAAIKDPPPVGAAVPEVRIPQPPADVAKYLGINEKGDGFLPGDVKAQVFIIEVFTIYCPHCQREAPVVNRLYQLIQDKGLGDKIKLIGIGANNSAFDVSLFKEEYKVPFPLLPDRKLEVTKALGVSFTPYFLIMKLDGKGGGKVIYSADGSFGDPQEFLAQITKDAGIP